jgi:GT2 family glycosyltransferase
LDLCLRSALAEPLIDNLIIVDHGNDEEVSAALRAVKADRRDVKVIAAPADATYAAAANLGAQAAKGRWLLFLDPDVVLQRGAVARMTAAGEKAQGPCVVGGRLTDLEGRERRVARGGALTAFSAVAVAVDWPARKPRRRRRRGDKAAPARVAAVSGAFMAIRRSDFEKLNGFDEGFITDAADLDLCRRAAEGGGSVLFQPAASGVQFVRAQPKGRRRAQGLARFADRMAKSPLERAFAVVAEPALLVLVGLKDFVVGRPPLRR